MSELHVPVDQPAVPSDESTYRLREVERGSATDKAYGERMREHLDTLRASMPTLPDPKPAPAPRPAPVKWRMP